jgi:hypothetical protein
MSRYILILAALLTTAFAPAGRGVSDPRALVQRTYAAYQRAGGESQVELPAYAYSPRLKALFDSYDGWAQVHSDEVGSLDFDWWMNAQDWNLHDVRVASRTTGPGRMIVTARFRNGERREAVRFLFVRLHGRWYLDDAVQGTGHPTLGWTLSALLRQREQ